MKSNVKNVTCTDCKNFNRDGIHCNLKCTNFYGDCEFFAPSSKKKKAKK